MKKINYIKYIDSCLGDTERPVKTGFFECVYFEAVGYLIKEDKISVTLAREIVNIDGEERARGSITIPKVAIVSRKVVR